jgi:hypothetical protein
MKTTNWDKIKEGTLLLVSWNDIVEDSSWISDKKAQTYPSPLCKTVGWFINDDKLSIRLSWSVADNGDKSIGVIPKGCIRDVKKINYKG